MVIGKIAASLFRRHRWDFTVNPNVKMRRISRNLGDSLPKVNKLVDDLKKLEDKSLDTKKSIESLRIKITKLRNSSKENNQKKIEKLQKKLKTHNSKITQYTKETTNTLEALDAFLEGVFKSLKTGHLSVLTLLHRARVDANELIERIIKVDSKNNIQLSRKKIDLFEEVKMLKGEIKRISYDFYLESKSQRTGVASHLRLREAIHALRSKQVLLRRLRQATIEIDNYEGEIDNRMAKLNIKSFPVFMKHWEKQLKEIRRVGVYFKSLTHQIDMLVYNKVGKIYNIPKIKKKLYDMLWYVERQSWHLHNDLYKDYNKIRAPKEEKIIKFQKEEQVILRKAA